ncbi:PilW family protein [Azoarcus sp. L1K30]|uniref:PilW family protein n=1 Tax=Azoarcus sp. L1K30 TaxID=2820277 RepID=UPI001B820669|nr:PilW family protein [Azoarcus sp. L1K30]MBR0564602.1 PilW family protein [Azoarcus sp. L1K30]
MPRPQVRPQNRQCGLTLVELMISLVLGLIVTGGAVSIFVGNRDANRATENLSRMQENSRIAFELMARSLREAGGNPCGAGVVANVLEDNDTTWWSNWSSNAIHGYDNTTASPAVTIGTGTGQRVSGTDTVILMAGGDSGVSIVSHDAPAAQFKVSTKAHGFKDGDILMACDNTRAAIFQTTQASDTNVTLVHNTGNTTSPGNCSKGLGYPTECSELGTAYSFEGNGYIVKLVSETWFIGNNARGGRSLFRSTPVINYADPKVAPTVVATEVVENVTDMQLLYKTRDPAKSGGTNDYVAAGSITDWSDVVAVNVELTFVSTDKISTAAGRPALERKLVQVATLRNRAP